MKKVFLTIEIISVQKNMLLIEQSAIFCPIKSSSIYTYWYILVMMIKVHANRIIFLQKLIFGLNNAVIFFSNFVAESYLKTTKIFDF